MVFRAILLAKGSTKGDLWAMEALEAMWVLEAMEPPEDLWALEALEAMEALIPGMAGVAGGDVPMTWHEENYVISINKRML